jgi:hypothetical protein
MIQGQARFEVNSATISPEMVLESLLVYLRRTQINPQVHGYRYSFHPEYSKYRIHREMCEVNYGPT